MSVSYGNLSTYPPTQCGLATFSKALVDSLSSAEDVVQVVSVVDAAGDPTSEEVCHEWVRGSSGSAAAAAVLNELDVAIIQHEYGIFAGRDGADVLDVVRALWVPTIVVLHTVLETPSARQRSILEELARNAVTVVTMTHTGQRRLAAHYSVDPAKIRVVPHGAVDNRGVPKPMSAHPVILTWGLLGEGKGIEWAIDAMADLADLRPRPGYQVVGQTHPRVLEQHGERYRDRLIDQAAASSSIPATSPQPICGGWSARQMSSCCPTTRSSRSRPGCSSKRSRRANPSWPQPFHTPASCWPVGPGSSSPGRTRPPSRPRCAVS